MQENLRRTRVTLDELTGHLRQKDVLDLSRVQYAILETNGDLSVFPYPQDRPACARDAGIPVGKQYLPLTLVSDGVILWENMQKAGKELSWLQRYLTEKKVSLKDTWLLTVDGAGNILFYEKERS